MKPSPPPHLAIDLVAHLYDQHVYTPPNVVPASRVDQSITDAISENKTNSQDMAFETRLSKQPWSLGSRGSGGIACADTLPLGPATRIGGAYLTSTDRQKPVIWGQPFDISHSLYCTAQAT